MANVFDYIFNIGGNYALRLCHFRVCNQIFTSVSQIYFYISFYHPIPKAMLLHIEVDANLDDGQSAQGKA